MAHFCLYSLYSSHRLCLLEVSSYSCNCHHHRASDCNVTDYSASICETIAPKACILGLCINSILHQREDYWAKICNPTADIFTAVQKFFNFTLTSTVLHCLLPKEGFETITYIPDNLTVLVTSPCTIGS
jgi:hypothetical protein